MPRISSKQLLLHAEGLAFTDGKYDLRTVEKIITAYRRVIDNSIPYAFGRKNLSDRIKEELIYKASFRKGSWELILEFIIDNKEALTLIAASDGGQQIVQTTAKLIDGIFKLRRMFTKLLEQGGKPKLRFGDHSKQNIVHDIAINDVQVIGGNIIVNPVTVIYAEKSRPAVDGLIKSIDGEQVSSIDLLTNTTQTNITVDDHRLTGTQKEELPNNIEVVGKLDVIAFSAHRGQLIIGDRKYPVSWGDEIRSKIHRFADTEGITYQVIPIIDHKRFHEEPVSFHILNCWDSQERLI